MDNLRAAGPDDFKQPLECTRKDSNQQQHGSFNEVFCNYISKYYPTPVSYDKKDLSAFVTLFASNYPGFPQCKSEEYHVRQWETAKKRIPHFKAPGDEEFRCLLSSFVGQRKQEDFGGMTGSVSVYIPFVFKRENDYDDAVYRVLRMCLLKKKQTIVMKSKVLYELICHKDAKIEITEPWFKDNLPCLFSTEKPVVVELYGFLKSHESVSLCLSISFYFLPSRDVALILHKSGNNCEGYVTANWIQGYKPLFNPKDYKISARGKTPLLRGFSQAVDHNQVTEKIFEVLKKNPFLSYTDLVQMSPNRAQAISSDLNSTYQFVAQEDENLIGIKDIFSYVFVVIAPEHTTALTPSKLVLNLYYAIISQQEEKREEDEKTFSFRALIVVKDGEVVDALMEKAEKGSWSFVGPKETPAAGMVFILPENVQTWMKHMLTMYDRIFFDYLIMEDSSKNKWKVVNKELFGPVHETSCSYRNVIVITSSSNEMNSTVLARFPFDRMKSMFLAANPLVHFYGKDPEEDFGFIQFLGNHTLFVDKPALIDCKKIKGEQKRVRSKKSTTAQTDVEGGDDDEATDTDQENKKKLPPPRQRRRRRSTPAASAVTDAETSAEEEVYRPRKKREKRSILKKVGFSEEKKTKVLEHEEESLEQEEALEQEGSLLPPSPLNSLLTDIILGRVVPASFRSGGMVHLVASNLLRHIVNETYQKSLDKKMLRDENQMRKAIWNRLHAGGKFENARFFLELFTTLPESTSTKAAFFSNDNNCKLPIFGHEKIDNVESSCHLCNQILVKQGIMTLPCRHVFCRLCISQYYQHVSKEYCPGCEGLRPQIPFTNISLPSISSSLSTSLSTGDCTNILWRARSAMFDLTGKIDSAFRIISSSECKNKKVFFVSNYQSILTEMTEKCFEEKKCLSCNFPDFFAYQEGIVFPTTWDSLLKIRPWPSVPFVAIVNDFQHHQVEFIRSLFAEPNIEVHLLVFEGCQDHLMLFDRPLTRLETQFLMEEDDDSCFFAIKKFIRQIVTSMTFKKFFRCLGQETTQETTTTKRDSDNVIIREENSSEITVCINNRLSFIIDINDETVRKLNAGEEENKRISLSSLFDCTDGSYDLPL
jgi:Zinc finger, C3HC4 type (RING finger)